MLTWTAAAFPLLFIIPIGAIAAGWADPRGDVGNLASLALLAVPVGGLLCLTGAVERKERLFPVRLLCFAIHGLWLLGLGFLLLVSAMFGMGDNW